MGQSLQMGLHVGIDHVEVVVDGQGELGLVPAGQGVCDLLVGVLELGARLEIQQDAPAHVGDEAVDGGGEGPVDLDDQLIA